MKSFSCQRWIDTWWPEQAVGGKKGREIYKALFPLTEKVTQGQFVVSLDFSLAFDYSRPDLVVSFSRDLGMPETICNILSVQWTNQQRYLSFENFVLPNPELVNSSLPQGDPWSMLGMVALLTPAMWEIARRYPTVLQKNFVDGRSFASSSMQEVLDVQAIWTSWSQDLQLQENTGKTQYFHPQARGRQSFLDHGIPANQVTDHITILGHACRGFRQRKLVDAEDARINQSVAVIRRIAYLPIPLAKAEFGWLLKTPPMTFCNRVQNAHAPKHASPNLKNLLRGHRLNFNFRIAHVCIGSVRRCLAKSHTNTLYAWRRTLPCCEDFLGLITALGFGNMN